MVRYLVYHISDSFKVRAVVYGGKLDGEDVEAMSEEELRDWLSAEPTRLELYAVARWHLPHSAATVPPRFGGARPKPPAEEVRPTVPATKADTDDTPPHADEPETPPAEGAPTPPPTSPPGDAPAPPASPPTAPPKTEVPPTSPPTEPPGTGTPPATPPTTKGPATI